MPRNRECDFCGDDIEPGTGTMFVHNDGTTVHYCSSKCEKNAELGREPRDLSWTAEGREARGPAVEAETDTEAASDTETEADADIEEQSEVDTEAEVDHDDTDIEDQGQAVDTGDDAAPDLESVEEEDVTGPEGEGADEAAEDGDTDLDDEAADESADDAEDKDAEEEEAEA